MENYANKESMQLKFDAFRERLQSLIDSKGLLSKDIVEEIGATPVLFHGICTIKGNQI